ncbi:hypothetical protein ACLKA7_001900, partial [Drosophila subpalustris]
SVIILEYFKQNRDIKHSN